jgi:hypothetical protein
MPLSVEESQALNDLLSRFNALQESLPKELAEIKESINQIQNRLGVNENSIDHIRESVMRQINDDVSQLDRNVQARVDKLGTEIYQHLSKNYALVSQIPSSQVQAPPPTVIDQDNLSSVKMRDPTTFTGKPNACNSFFSQLSLCYAANERRFKNDQDKVLFAISHMEGNAFAYMEPYMVKLQEPIANRPSILTDFNVFKSTITSAFGDSNPIVNAEAAIRSLKQVGPMSVYATEFRRLSMLLSWNESALISQYILNIKDTVQDELARRDPITTLDLVISTTIDIDNRLFNRTRQKKQGNHPKNDYHPKFNNQKNNRSTPTNETPSSGPQPMDLSTATIHRGPLTDSQKQYRRDNNLCLYCGDPGHSNFNCPKKKGTSNKPKTNISTILFTEEQDSKNDQAQ